MATPFQNALFGVGYNPNQIVALQLQGVRDLTDLAMLTEQNIRDMGKRIYESQQVDFPIIATQKLIVIHYWRRKLTSAGQVANAADITVAMLTRESEEYQLHKQLKEDRKQSEAVVKPEKFTRAEKWRTFHDAVKAYLQGVEGVSNIPLVYVIRQDATPPPNVAYANALQRTIANAPLTGAAYTSDNHRVHGIIKSLVLEGPGDAFIRSFDSTRDGRGAWLALLAHYEGHAYLERRKTEAYKILDSTHYDGDKRNFDFETYVTRHQRAHEDLNAANEPMTESRKVSLFLSNITYTPLTSAVEVVRAQPGLLQDFTQTANYLARIVNERKPPGRGGHRSISDTRGGGRYGRGGRRRGRGRGGRGGRGRGRGDQYETLDQEVNRLAQMRRIDNNHWNSMPAWKRERVTQRRKAIKANKQQQQQSDLSSRISEIESFITRHASQPGNDNNAPPPNIDTGNNNNSGSTNDSPSQLTNSGASLFGRNAHRSEGAIRTEKRVHRVFDLNSIPSRHTINTTEGRLELDSHADTCCAGPEVRVIDYTGLSCTVHGFSDSLLSLNDVPIKNRVMN